MHFDLKIKSMDGILLIKKRSLNPCSNLHGSEDQRLNYALVAVKLFIKSGPRSPKILRLKDQNNNWLIDWKLVKNPDEAEKNDTDTNKDENKKKNKSKIKRPKHVKQEQNKNKSKSM